MQRHFDRVLVSGPLSGFASFLSLFLIFFLSSPLFLFICKSKMKLPKPTKLPSNSSRLNLGIKGSSKVLSYINQKCAKRSSAAIQNYHLAGVRGGGEAAYNTRSHTAASELSNPTTCVMTRDASGNYKFKEENKRAWGFLIQNKQEPFLLIRHVEYRKTNEPAGYSIGGDPESAIRYVWTHAIWQW